MPALPRPKHERFCQLIVQGCDRTEAAVKVGVSSASAKQRGHEIYKRPDVQARIDELRNASVEMTVTTASISKAWVIDGLRQTIDDGRRAGNLNVVRACFVDIGKELGMFTEKPARKFIDWDGDVSSLSDQELEQLQYLMERLAWGNDEAKIQSERRRIAAEAGVNVIDVSPAGSEVSAQVEVKKDEPW